MKIQLSDHFTYGRLLRFTLPSIVMMIFTSIYGVVDGIFVSNFAGKTAFAAVNLIMPYLMIFGVAIIIIVAYMLVPRIVNIITMAGKKSDPVVEQQELDNSTFNPYTPITVVPNDYQEQ